MLWKKCPDSAPFIKITLLLGRNLILNSKKSLKKQDEIVTANVTNSELHDEDSNPMLGICDKINL